MPINSWGITVGFTSDRYLLLDLDKCSLWKALRMARGIRTMWPFLGAVLVRMSSYGSRGFRWMWSPSKWRPIPSLESSGYHLIYDNEITFDQMLAITETLEALDVLEVHATTIRRKRGDNTLRVNEWKPYRVEPRQLGTICFQIGEATEGGGIGRYLDVAKVFKPDMLIYRRDAFG